MGRVEPRPVGAAGFSLLEAMLTLGIVGILLGIAIPALRPVVQRNELELERDRVVELLSAAGDAARAHGRDVCAFAEGTRVRVGSCEGDAPLDAPAPSLALTDARFAASVVVRFTAAGDSAPARLELEGDGMRAAVSVERWGRVR